MSFKKPRELFLKFERKRVQTVLQNKGGHKKYSAACFYKIIETAFAYILFYYTNFLANCKETMDGSRYLRNAMYI